MKNQNNLVQFSIQTIRHRPLDLEIIKKILISLGIKDDEIVEVKEWNQSYLAIYFGTYKGAEKFDVRLKKLHLSNFVTTIKTIKKKDWEDRWKNDFKPFVLTRKFSIIPARFKNRRYFPLTEPIFIEPGMAFGTGLHATTRFMSQFIERLEGQFESFFDIGTGTGILSVIASKCGATEIDAIDISDDAIETSRINFQKNNSRVGMIKKIDIAKITIKKQYDYVAANLVTQDLIDLKIKILSFVSPGKYLAVSGISQPNLKKFRNAFKELPLRCLKIEKGDGWVALLYKRSQS